MVLRKLFLTIIYILILYCFTVSVFLIYYANKNYDEQDNIYLQNNALIVNNTYLTNYSYNNKLLSDDKTFVIIDVDTSIKRNNLYLKINNKLYNCLDNNKYQEYFKDLDNDPLIYAIPIEYTNKSMLLFYNYDHNNLDRNIYVKLNPIRLNYSYNETIVNLNENISIKNVIDNFNIKAFDIKNKFNYKYLENEKEVTSIIKSNNKTILKLDIINSNIPNNFEDYIKVKYNYNDKIYVSSPIDKTPNNIKNSLFYEIDNNILKAKEVWLEIKNRKEIYKFILK